MFSDTNLFHYKTGKWEVIRTYLANPLRNFNYVLINKDKATAIAVDPSDINFLKHVIESNDVALEAILITHEHSDHIEGIHIAGREFPRAKIYGPSGVEQYLKEDVNTVINFVGHGDYITVSGDKIEVLHTPGHTAMHISFLIDDEKPILISGDVVFALGVGRCKLGGNVDDLFHTIKELATRFDDDTTIYLPGHDLLESNFNFSSQFECDTGSAQKELEVEEYLRPIRTISDECRHNLFFISCTQAIVDVETENINDDQKANFISLRAQRDNY